MKTQATQVEVLSEKSAMRLFTESSLAIAGFLLAIVLLA
jgi:hypothetical protein